MINVSVQYNGGLLLPMPAFINVCQSLRACCNFELYSHLSITSRFSFNEITVNFISILKSITPAFIHVLYQSVKVCCNFEVFPSPKQQQ